jgi:hypothetical protein
VCLRDNPAIDRDVGDAALNALIAFLDEPVGAVAVPAA